MNAEIMAMRMVQLAETGRGFWHTTEDFLSEFPKGKEAMTNDLIKEVGKLGWSLRPAKIEHEHMTSLGMISGEPSGVKLVRL